MNEVFNIDYKGMTATLKAMPIEEQVDGRKFAPRPAMLVLPGGGYAFTSDREAEPVARYFNAAGFHAFVLRYSVNTDSKGCFPAPFYQAAKAMEIIRKNAAQWNLDPNRIGVIGFSAGGHLAAWLANGCDSDFAHSIGIDEKLSRPNAQVLSYPVISTGKYTDGGSIENLCGCTDYRESEKFPELSCEKMVTKNSPPAFIWQTANDYIVPVGNSLVMAQALYDNCVRYELHIFDEGPHGLSVCDETTEMVSEHCADWKKLCLDFIKKM